MTATSPALSREIVAGASKKYIKICFSMSLVDAMVSGDVGSVLDRSNGRRAGWFNVKPGRR